MSDLIIKKNGTDYKFPMLAEHYPADRVYLDGDINKTVQDALTYIIKSATFSGSTDANSNVVVTNDVNKIVLGIVPSIACIPTPFLWNNGNWYAHITNEAGTGVGSGVSVSGDFYYIDKL